MQLGSLNNLITWNYGFTWNVCLVLCYSEGGLDSEMAYGACTIFYLHYHAKFTASNAAGNRKEISLVYNRLSIRCSFGKRFKGPTF